MYKKVNARNKIDLNKDHSFNNMEKHARNPCAWYICPGNTFGLCQTNNNIPPIFKCTQQKSIRKKTRSYINFKEFFD